MRVKDGKKDKMNKEYLLDSLWKLRNEGDYQYSLEEVGRLLAEYIDDEEITDAVNDVIVK